MLESPNIIIIMADELRGDVITNPNILLPNITSFRQDSAATFLNHFSVNPVCGPSRCCTFTGQYVHSNAHRSLYQLLQPHEENLFHLLKKAGYKVYMIGRNDLFTEKALKNSLSSRTPIIPLIIRKTLRSIPFKVFIKIIPIAFHALRHSQDPNRFHPILKLLEPYMKQNPYSLDDPYRNSFYFGRRTPLQSEFDTDDLLTRRALSFIKKRKTSKSSPFCLFIAYNFPHPPYTVEDPYFSMVNREDITEIIPPIEENPLHNIPTYYKLMRDTYGLSKLKSSDLKEIRATYYGMAAKLDHQIGSLLSVLKQQGLYDNSLILFTSDHGDFAGDYGLTEKWPNAMNDCLLKVPLIIRFPKLNSNTATIYQLTQSIDLFPTILQLVNIKTNYTHYGKTLTDLIQGKEGRIHSEVFAEGGYDPREPQCYESHIGGIENNLSGIYFHKIQLAQDYPSSVCRTVMIRNEEFKLVLKSMEQEINEFYDLKKDPHETINQIKNSEYSSQIQEMKENLLRWYLKTSDNPHWEHIRSL